MRIFILSLLFVPAFVSAATTTKATSTPLLDCINLTETITYGSTDARYKNQVSLVQKFLIQRGFLAGTPTGTFNSASISALKKYQAKSRIADLGITDAKTRDRIKKDTCSAAQIAALQKKPARPKALASSTSKAKVAPREIVVKKVTTTVRDTTTGQILGSTTTVHQTGKVSGKLVSTTSTTTKSSAIVPIIKEKGKIQVLSPFAGLSIKAGYPTNIKWGAAGYGSEDLFKVVLVNGVPREVGRIPTEFINEYIDIPLANDMKAFTAEASSLSESYKNSGTYSWSVPNNLPYGTGYRIFVGPVDNLSAGVYGEPFTILGTGMMPVIKNVRTTKTEPGTYLVNITGENLRSTLSAKYTLNGRQVGQTDASSIKVFGTTQMQYTISDYEMGDMPTGVYYKVVLFDEEQESEPKNIVFW